MLTAEKHVITMMTPPAIVRHHRHAALAVRVSILPTPETAQPGTMEKEILRVKYTRGVSFPEARKIVDSCTLNQNSYAQRVKTKIQTCDASTQTCDASTQTEPNPTSSDSSSNQKSVNNKHHPSSQKSVPSTSNKPTDKPVPSTSSSSSSSTPNKQGANQRPQSSTPRRRINVSSDRAKKGSEDPITQYNKFGPLTTDEDMDLSSSTEKHVSNKNNT